MTSSSHGSKRSRRSNKKGNEDVKLPQQPLRHFALCWVMEKEGKKWFKEHKESKYSHEMFIDKKSLALEFPHIVERLHTLGLGFVLNDPGECNLNMVREFLANWDPKESERYARIDDMLIHLYDMKMVQLIMNFVIEEQLQQLNMDYPLTENSKDLCRVGLGFEEPLNDDIATDEK
ncbi:hypothetical protein HAX54_017511 [Datura stramonium]|uniref:Uncharacterized protein n=1 Tax=Datura stramonium TaxID=4076 RepID=A0ABS8UN38_DATST|nr:hypothetical protein [Datura stramonium]